MAKMLGTAKKEGEAGAATATGTDNAAPAANQMASSSGGADSSPPQAAPPAQKAAMVTKAPAAPMSPTSQMSPGALRRPDVPRRHSAASAVSASPSRSGQNRQLVVGYGISLSGEIKDCEQLVVEGSVAAALVGSELLQIVHGGVFRGPAVVEEAEIGGLFEGEMTAKGRLVVKAGGRVDGSVRYGEIEIQPGGVVTGTLELLES